MGWALFKEQEVRDLRTVLSTHANCLSLLIVTAGAYVYRSIYLNAVEQRELIVDRKSSLRIEKRQEEERGILVTQRTLLENLRF